MLVLLLSAHAVSPSPVEIGLPAFNIASVRVDRDHGKSESKRERQWGEVRLQVMRGPMVAVGRLDCAYVPRPRSIITPCNDTDRL